ncbi:MAG: hypothetical protein A2289_13420 [Deltaproteobacteria bacterium RIFOXYA12_FULL_58_15]|nr:MAG: hypothetical protein A2289_13420 [Deltaproteobacteria bacterium RIFOXYA12_FULL_58_15]OGR13792.1 MAG: hypothetical protein A2341_27475 [Deltaproteobacteria bacterium RIFOXYB12_FULL_58_9]
MVHLKSKRVATAAATLLVANFALATMIGCRRGPDAAQLQADLQTELDQSFEPGLFGIVSLSRKGHYPYSVDTDERARVLIYYNAEIEFLKNHELSNWDALNVGSLISVLGATPKGVRGVKPEGNRVGDRIEVRGTAAFVENDERWEPTIHRPTGTQEDGQAPTDKNLIPYRARLEEIGEVGSRFDNKKDKRDLVFLEQELSRVLAAARQRAGKRAGSLTFATGAPGGEYFRQGELLARVLTDAGFVADAFPTAGSLESCRLVEDGDVLIGFAQNDVANMAYGGTGLFEGEVPMKSLRALASLYPEAIQIVVKRSSGINNIADLHGRRIDISPPGSGSRINAIEVLAAGHLTLGDFSQVQGKRISEATADLVLDKIDAVIFTSAFPTKVIHDAATSTPLRLLTLDDELVGAVRERHSFLLEMSLPKNTYPGMDNPVNTVGVTAMLVANESTPAARIETFLGHLFGNVDILSQNSSQAYLISVKTARSGISIPLHEAAEGVLKRLER